MSPKNRLSAPAAKGGARLKRPETPPDYDGMRPVWDFEHMVPGFGLRDCDEPHRAAFAAGMEKRSQLTWRQLKSEPREKLGFELIPVAQIAAPLPKRVVTPDVTDVIVVRCGGLRRLIGIRRDQIFLVLVCDASGSCYAHGS